MTEAAFPTYACPVRVLALDTSTELGSVACLVEGELRAEVSARVRARHGETLLTLVRQVLDHAKLDRRELDLVAVGLGPGSFTGTRVGVATAKGLSLALDVPLMGVVSLRAIARGAPGRWIAPVVDAHKGEVYAAVYERAEGGLEERLTPAHMAPDAAWQMLEALGQPLTLCGSGLTRYPDTFARTLDRTFDQPRAALIALEAMERFERDGPDDRASLEPLYVRPSDAKLPQSAGATEA